VFGTIEGFFLALLVVFLFYYFLRNGEKIKDVIAGILSLFFILIVFALYFINLFGGNIHYQNLWGGEITKYDLDEHSLQKINQSCSLNLPENPTIILKMDDVRAYSVPIRYLVNGIIKENMSATLGVIPRDLEKDRGMQNYLIKIRNSGNIEIAQHGSDHNESDIQITKESLLEGNKKIQEILGVRPVTYMPPYNNISRESKKIIEDYFLIMSGDQDVLRINNIPEIGYSIPTYYYSTKKYVSIEEIIQKCQKDLKNKNLCIVTIHPQEYSYDINNARTLSPARLKEFKQMLTELKKLNASYSTYSDLIVCN
jgi:peptidoglycan/xylan/chitin deacetylase (PgdA/CDA1 family)